MLAPQIAKALAGDRFELIILPTEKCNFRCAYCYEDFQIGRMKQGVVNGIKNLVLRRLPSLKEIRLDWFGGEPLLAYDLILDICKFTKRHCQLRGVRFDSHMTTNGWALDQERFEQLVESNVTAYQITLDGPQASHDKTRKMLDGRGTFSKIYANLKMMQGTAFDFHVTIRLHLSRSNFDAVKEFTQILARDFSADERFDLSPHTIRDLGGEAVDRSDIFSVAECELREREIRDLYNKTSSKPNAVPETLHVCYAAKANSFLIRPNGTIGKCTVDLYNERNAIGRLNEDGTMQVDDDRFAKWVVGLTTGNPAQLLCPLSSVQF